MRGLLFLFILLAQAPMFITQRCPFFGDTVCPDGYQCQIDRCVDEAGKEPLGDCSKLNCGRDALCTGLGRCVPFSGKLCGRNVLVGQGLARTIVSDCGPRGKCIGGRCSIDNCLKGLRKVESYLEKNLKKNADVLCDETNEQCRDGMCLPLASVLCFSPFDCGPPSLYECRQQRCQRRLDTLGPAFSRPTKCDPGEMLSGDKCVTQDGTACAQIVCPSAHSCFNGICVPASGTNCAHSGECADLQLCRDGRCVTDVCASNSRSKCPPEHACSPTSIPEGECRHLQGLLCSHSAAVEDCPPPYFCIGGVCTKDECYRKACQIGERCDSGICIRIEGNSCRDATKDCGEQFICTEGVCRDQISAYSEEAIRAATKDSAAKASIAVGGGNWN